MLHKTIRIATRNSPLALWQAHYVQHFLMSMHPELNLKLVPIKTTGDIFLKSKLNKIGGKGIFVKELELAILEGRADLAVHSMKDLPIDLPPGLSIVAICKREDPHDVFLSNRYNSIYTLPQGAIIGTSSLRRQCQLRAFHSNLIIRSLHGNIGTRLNKLDAGEYDAIILSAAGLNRLGLQNRILQKLPVNFLLPAVGQGAIGIECRLDNHELIMLLQAINDSDTAVCINAERSMSAHLNGGCQVPIGSFAMLKGTYIWLRGLVGSPDGSRIIIGELYGFRHEAKQIGKLLAEKLLNCGARDILKTIYQEHIE